MNSFTIKRIVQIAVMAAILCVVSPLSVPLTAGVPLSLATLVIMLAGVLMGPIDGMLATLVFLLIGAVGMPVFASFQAGIGVLFGKTGGFILGYIPLALCSGLFVRWPQELTPQTSRRVVAQAVPGMLLGTVILYVLGTVWFLVLTHATLKVALFACVIPFLPGDALKMVLVCVLSPLLHKALEKSNRVTV